MTRTGPVAAVAAVAVLLGAAGATGTTSLETYPPDGNPPATVGGVFIRADAQNPEGSSARSALTIPLRAGPDLLLPKRSLRTPIAGSGGPGVDEVNGARGDDVLKGGPATDVVRGLAGDDTLLGSAGDDLQARIRSLFGS